MDEMGWFVVSYQDEHGKELFGVAAKNREAAMDWFMQTEFKNQYCNACDYFKVAIHPYPVTMCEQGGQNDE